MNQSTRYQGAIAREHRFLLLLQCRLSTGERYWVLPGGRRERGESEAQCVEREMLEETRLSVEVGALLPDEAVVWGTIRRRKTYLCTEPSGVPRPGYEPESAYASDFAFTAVQWIDLRTPTDWPDELTSDAAKHDLLHRIRAALGYA